MYLFKVLLTAKYFFLSYIYETYLVHNRRGIYQQGVASTLTSAQSIKNEATA